MKFKAKGIQVQSTSDGDPLQRTCVQRMPQHGTVNGAVRTSIPVVRTASWGKSSQLRDGTLMHSAVHASSLAVKQELIAIRTIGMHRALRAERLEPEVGWVSTSCGSMHVQT
jgi:hypothetical protein